MTTKTRIGLPGKDADWPSRLRQGLAWRTTTRIGLEDDDNAESDTDDDSHSNTTDHSDIVTDDDSDSDDDTVLNTVLH